VLFGAFDTKFVYGLVASAGVALAAVYMIRMYQRSMHNPTGLEVASREMSLRDGLVLVPLVLVILALSVYPQLVLDRSEDATEAQIAPATEVATR
jgi:NADH-quinone oxidoreductase subunit M